MIVVVIYKYFLIKNSRKLFQISTQAVHFVFNFSLYSIFSSGILASHAAPFDFALYLLHFKYQANSMVKHPCLSSAEKPL